jgi:hypothetical protein
MPSQGGDTSRRRLRVSSHASAHQPRSPVRGARAPSVASPGCSLPPRMRRDPIQQPVALASPFCSRNFTATSRVVYYRSLFFNAKLKVTRLYYLPFVFTASITGWSGLVIRVSGHLKMEREILI